MANPYPAEIIDSNGFVKAGVEITFTDSGNQPGGATPGAAIVRGPFAFDYTQAAALANGVQVFVPTVGDILLDAWVEIDTAFDGTTPAADVSQFGGTTTGWFGSILNAIDLTHADITANFGTGILTGTGSGSPAGSLVDMGANGTTYGNPKRYVPAKFTAANPVLLAVSQNGTKGGTAIDSTVGAGKVYIVTSTPVAFS